MHTLRMLPLTVFAVVWLGWYGARLIQGLTLAHISIIILWPYVAQYAGWIMLYLISRRAVRVLHVLHVLHVDTQNALGSDTSL